MSADDLWLFHHGWVLIAWHVCQPHCGGWVAASTTLSHIHVHVFCSVWMYITYFFTPPPPPPLWLAVSVASIISLSPCFSVSLLCFFSPGFSLCLAFLIASLRLSYFPLAAFFPSSVQSIVCQSNMWQVVRGKSKSEEGEKSTLTKAPSPELACSCKKKKKKHQLPPWLNDVSTTLRMLPLLRWMAQLGST